jgi:repressor LexA
LRILALADRIKAMRIAMGLTQEEVASRMHVAKQTIQKYESGAVTNIPLGKVEELAAILHTDGSHLMGWDKKLAAPVWNDELSKVNIDIFSKLTDSQKAEALRYMQKLADNQ